MNQLIRINTDHFLPIPVDTSDVDGEIIRLTIRYCHSNKNSLDNGTKIK